MRPGTRPCYATSQLFIERDLAAYSDWTPETVLERRKALVQWALSRWKVEGPASDVTAGSGGAGSED